MGRVIEPPARSGQVHLDPGVHPSLGVGGVSLPKHHFPVRVGRLGHLLGYETQLGSVYPLEQFHLAQQAELVTLMLREILLYRGLQDHKHRRRQPGSRSNRPEP